jgi:hypothetical protein
MSNVNNDLELYSFSVELVIHSLKLQNKTLLESCVKNLALLIGSEQTSNIVTAAILELSKISLPAFRWTLDNFSDFKIVPSLFESKKILEGEASFISNQDDVEQFVLNVEFVSHCLKTQDQRLLETSEKILNHLLGIDHASNIFVAALFELATAENVNFEWDIEILSALEPYRKIFKIVSMSAAEKLIRKGFIPGQDFSADGTGKILLSQQTKTALIESISEIEDHILLDKILKVPEAIN